HPRRIDGSRIRSNLDTIVSEVLPEKLIVERHQRRLTDEELALGRPIVLLGLGNSTAAMLHQIHRYEDAHPGKAIDYLVLTDLPKAAVEDPTREVNGHKSVFRKPKQKYLTGYSGDLERDRESYYRALDDKRIVPGVCAVNYDRVTGSLVIEDAEGEWETEKALVFALIGYERDQKLLRSIGALVGGEVSIRPCDGAVSTETDGYSSSVYALGSFAATRENPNAGVIPGIQGQVPGTFLTHLIRTCARDRGWTKAA
ncbi:MAG: hypothetical protein JWL85_250, partial [Candidatus Saccharibacteria bacterium]|nr:hypothetical protein [Candidatus Saccharibacteria bacterium]